MRLYSPDRPISPGRLLGSYPLLLLALAIPPLSLIIVPHFVMTHVQVIRRALQLRRDRDAYITEANLVGLGNLARRGGR